MVKLITYEFSTSYKFTCFLPWQKWFCSFKSFAVANSGLLPVLYPSRFLKALFYPGPIYFSAETKWFILKS
jgi:hypothetical protein